MKMLLIFLFSVSLFNFSNLDSISAALQEGDATVLATYFDEQVEVSILDQEIILNKATAKSSLVSFFVNHKPIRFDQVHTGTSKTQNSIYCIGNLVTVKQTFRVYVFIKIENDKQFIHELRIDEE